jgi:hypothetical protein
MNGWDGKLDVIAADVTGEPESIGWHCDNCGHAETGFSDPDHVNTVANAHDCRLERAYDDLRDANRAIIKVMNEREELRAERDALVEAIRSHAGIADPALLAENERLRSELGALRVVRAIDSLPLIEDLQADNAELRRTIEEMTAKARPATTMRMAQGHPLAWDQEG